ncbi:MAG: SDR family NAD(P)-dependent oxidoreductase [Bacteriovoracaceae bacterium]
MDLETPIMRPLALVTGASSGIGLELAKQFAEHGFDLLITARDSDLEGPREILNELGADVSIFHADLSRGDGVEALYKEIKKMSRPLEAAAINAGFGSGGPFVETDLRNELELIRLNCMSAIHLTKRILPEMIKNGSGRILFTSSISAITPVPFEAVYAASKAFLFSFAESLRNELKDTGVSVTALLPGPTNTNFFRRAGLSGTKVGEKMKFQNTPEEVARQGFVALMKGKDHVMGGTMKTKVAGAAYKIIPEWAKAYVHRNMSEPGSAEEKMS